MEKRGEAERVGMIGNEKSGGEGLNEWKTSDLCGCGVCVRGVALFKCSNMFLAAGRFASGVSLVRLWLIFRILRNLHDMENLV